MNFKQLNVITGWAVFLIASLVYILSVEPTASFWDVGEFIASAYKLEIGHPPGAPFFMLMGRLFSAFVPIDQVAVAVNLLSVFSSSFTILFLFWSITHLAKKLALNGNQEWNNGKIIAVISSGVVGALAYTFSDSFWFSAVEGEVYAMSSLFTAVVFWAILKWESLSNGHNETRWIVLIAYLMGISIGVHLLNLLAIPAICFVFYFKRYKTTTKGIILTALASLLILGFIQVGIIPGVVSLAGKFELLFVNTFNLPFNTGIIIYAILAISLLVYGLYWTKKNNHPVYHLITLCITVIILGYSTYAVIVIRSSVDPPLDENNPENVFTLLSYLNREQYGDRPLLYGQYWNAPLDESNPRIDGDPVYTKSYVIKNKADRITQSFITEFGAKQYLENSNNKDLKIEQEYIISDPREGSVYNYSSEFKTVFPRMFSSQENHVSAYKSWSEYEGKPVRVRGNDGQPSVINKPTFGENMNFFFRYQFNFMYWRYFMWNFAGKQNDIQGHGSLLEGNWLSGVDFIDQERLGPQDNLPQAYTDNFAYNKFYLLPVLLGIIGLIFQLYKKPEDWLVTFLLFILTGIAIVVYLNQTPYQPRERDYAYAGSFYAFAIWIGLGVYAIFDAAFNLTKKQLTNILYGVVGSGAVIYLFESIGDGQHFFSYSIFYMGLIALAIFAIMFFLGKSIKNPVVLSVLALLITLPVPAIMGIAGWDDHDRSNRYTAPAFAENYLQSLAPNAILFTNGDNDTFPLWYAQEVEGVRTDVRVVNLSLLNTDWYINQMKKKAYESEPIPFEIPEPSYRQGTRDIIVLDNSRNTNESYVDIKRAIDFVLNDKNTVRMGNDNLPYIPSKNFFIPVDKEKVLANGTVSSEDADKIVDRVEWKINRSYILKNNLMLLDLLANNNWERPIYFAVTTGPDSYLNLQDYFQLEGMAYRLVPIKAQPNRNPQIYGSVNSDAMYDNVMNKFKWGGMDGEQQIYMDENNRRMTTNLRMQLANLADDLIAEEKTDKAVNVLDKAMEVMPRHNVPYDRIVMALAEGYYKAGEREKADEISKELFEIYEDEFDYFLTMDPQWAYQMRQDMNMAFMLMQRVQSVTTQFNPNGAISKELEEKFNLLNKAYDAKIQELTNEQQRTQDKIRF